MKRTLIKRLQGFGDRAAAKRQQIAHAAGYTMAFTGLVLMNNPAFAQALTPVTNASNILRDTIVGITLAIMTGAWGYGGMRMAFYGASVKDMQGPFIGGAICGGCAAMAAAFMPA